MSQLDLLNEAREISNSIKEWRKIADGLQQAKTQSQIAEAIGDLKNAIRSGSVFFQKSDIELHLNYYIIMKYITEEEAKELLA